MIFNSIKIGSVFKDLRNRDHRLGTDFIVKSCLENISVSIVYIMLKRMGPQCDTIGTLVYLTNRITTSLEPFRVTANSAALTAMSIRRESASTRFS